MYCSPPMIRIGSVGASDTFSAGRASALRRPTLSSIPTPALRRCIPSIRITPRFASSGYPRRTPAAVDFVPSMRTISPSFNSRIFMTSGSMRTIPRPASAGFASATRRNFSRPAAISACLLSRRDRTRGPRRTSGRIGVTLTHVEYLETKEKRERSRAASLDRHLDGLRLRGRLLLRNADLEDSVFQRRGGAVGLDLLREAQHAVEGLIGALAVLVVLVLLLPGAVRLRADLNPIRGDGQVDVLLRNAGEFRTDHEFGTLVDQADERFVDAQVGVGPPVEGTSAEADLEAAAEVVEPAVHVVQPGEGRNGRPRQDRLAILSVNLLALSLHGASLQEVFFAVNNVYAVLYKYYDSGYTFWTPALGSERCPSPSGGLGLPLDGDRDRAAVELDPCDLDRIHVPARHVDEDRRSYADLKRPRSDNASFLKSRVTHRVSLAPGRGRRGRLSMERDGRRGPESGTRTSTLLSIPWRPIEFSARAAKDCGWMQFHRVTTAVRAPNSFVLPLDNRGCESRDIP